MAIVASPLQKRNALWPLQRGPKGWRTGTIAKRYTAAIRHLVRTPLGSLIWAPNFGTRLHIFRTQALTDVDKTLSASEIASAMARWIPDVVLLGVEFDKNPDSETLEVTVVWAIQDASGVGTGSDQPRFAFGPSRLTVSI